MKTDDILNLDCTIETNVKKLNNFLWKIKPIAKLLEKNNYTKTQKAPIEILEQGFRGLCFKYGFGCQGINTIIDKDNKTFIFYDWSILRLEDRKWMGTVYGKTLWETVAKGIIKVYSEILKQKQEETNN